MEHYLIALEELQTIVYQFENCKCEHTKAAASSEIRRFKVRCYKKIQNLIGIIPISELDKINDLLRSADYFEKVVDAIEFAV